MIESYYVKLGSASYERSNGTPTKFVRNTLLQSSTRAHKGSYFSYGFFLPRFFQINCSGVKILQPAIFAIATHLIAAYFQVLNTRRFNTSRYLTKLLVFTHLFLSFLILILFIWVWHINQ